MSRYAVNGRCIVDNTKPKSSIDIRELIDSSSYEFQSSRVPASERLLIIEAIGFEPVVSALRDVFREKGRQFIEGQDGYFDIAILQELANKEVV